MKTMKKKWLLACYIGSSILFGTGFSLRAQTSPETSGKPAYQDTNQSFEKRTKDLISLLSVEEKAMLLDHKGPELERLNILSDKWNQCLHGVVWNKPTTMFPIPTAMGATWDPALIHEVANAISDEARAIYNGWHNDPNFEGDKKGLIYRAPVVNISRNPYWGRINEIYSEDPYLTGRMGVAYVKGLQGDDPKYLKLVSTLKHYAVNNVETDRQKLNAKVGERWLFEYWLPHFRDCIVEGKAQSVMASYNAINGVPNNINKYLLTYILKKQWGFEGFVVSDLGGVKTMIQGHEAGNMTYEEAVAKSIIAGCDFSDKEYRENIPKAVAMGILPIERLNDAVYRVMRDRFRLGEFDPPAMVPFSKIPMSIICSPEHRKLSRKVAEKSIVLLKNDRNFLPLDKKKIRTIAVIGPHANLFTAGGYSGKVLNPVTPLQGIQNLAGNDVEILYAAGAEIPARKKPDAPPVKSSFNQEDELKKAISIAAKADVVILFIGTTLATEAEGNDRITLGLPGNQQQLAEEIFKVNPKTVVVEMNAGPLAIPWIKEHVPAIVEAWWGGEEGGNAMANVLFGNVNPGGKMPLTVYVSDNQVPPQDEYDISKGFTYMYMKEKPLFPFGHGLSYTTFKYSDLKISSSKIKTDGSVSVQLKVKNTGSRQGDEVVQIYVHEVKSSVIRPFKELRGFERISLQPGETKSITINISAEKLAFYEEKTHGFVIEPGVFEVLAGSSSEDIRLKDHFEVLK
ncbi:MAG: glycoside hydrolase family 3 C-terminal domain-containing protein [Prolixibacteraceae bacterium]